MARALRFEYPGAVYHIMSRGDRGEPIYRDDKDREIFMTTLEEACGKTGWRIHAYVLMGNHYHLLLETPEGNMVSGMKWMLGTYTQRFNSRHKVVGHLFQGRYKALNLDQGDPTYFGVVSTYIHLNPVRARLIRVGKEPLRGYRWSSFPQYLAVPKKRPEWLHVDRVLGALGYPPTRKQSAVAFEAYLETRALECNRAKSREELEEQWRKIRRGWYLGDKSFKKRLLEVLRRGRKERIPGSVAGDAVRARNESEGEGWVMEGLKVLGIEDSQLEGMINGAAEKQLLAWWLRKHSTLSRRWIAQRLMMGDESNVTHAVREMRQAQRGRLASQKRKLEALIPKLRQETPA